MPPLLLLLQQVATVVMAVSHRATIPAAATALGGTAKVPQAVMVAAAATVAHPTQAIQPLLHKGRMVAHQQEATVEVPHHQAVMVEDHPLGPVMEGLQDMVGRHRPMEVTMG